MNVKSLLLAMTAALCVDSAVALNWTTDFQAAKATARDQDKAMFVFFTGSDWCGWCKKLDREILSTTDFAMFATPNLVLVKVDFPRYAPLPLVQAAANDKLAAELNIQGYPTVVIFGKDGREVARLGYQEGGPGPFINRLKSIGGINWRGSSSSGGSGAAANPNVANSAGGASSPFTFNGATLQPPKRYNELQLTGIMGTKKRPMIIVNNQTLEVGETAKVRLRDKEVWVTCKEIRPKSALVVTEGSREPMEIFLASAK